MSEMIQQRIEQPGIHEVLLDGPAASVRVFDAEATAFYSTVFEKLHGAEPSDATAVPEALATVLQECELTAFAQRGAQYEVAQARKQVQSAVNPSQEWLKKWEYASYKHFMVEGLQTTATTVSMSALTLMARRRSLQIDLRSGLRGFAGLVRDRQLQVSGGGTTALLAAAVSEQNYWAASFGLFGLAGMAAYIHDQRTRKPVLQMNAVAARDRNMAMEDPSISRHASGLVRATPIFGESDPYFVDLS